MCKFDHNHFLKLAKELACDDKCSAGLNDARHRSAISRAYYAVFLAAREINGNQSITHYDLIAWVRQRNNDVGDAMKKLKLKREDADYDKPIAYLMGNVVQACIDDAEELLKDLQSLASQ